MEQKLKKYLNECLWVYVHPHKVVPPCTPEPEPEAEPEPEPEPEPDSSNDARIQQWSCDIKTHHLWVHALEARLKQTMVMSEEEQNEGIRRASELLAIRRSLMFASVMTNGEDITADALRDFDNLGLIEVDSSEASYYSASGSDRGGSDEELA
jgi:hypothetical protein